MRILSTFALILAVLALSCGGSASLMTWHQYQGSPHQWPYFMQTTNETGRLYYFGVQHTNEPRDAQIATLEAAWSRLRPTRAFNEGGDPPVVRTREDEISHYGEAGFVRWLAARDGVPVDTLDLTRREQSEALLVRWSAEQTKLFLIQRALLPCEDRTDCDREAEVNRILPVIEASTGLQSAPHNWQEFQDSLVRVAPGDGSHRQWFDPTKNSHRFNEMARRVEDARDLHMIAVLVAATRKGERVFAVAGGSHVVRQERAIRAGMRQ